MQNTDTLPEPLAALRGVRFRYGPGLPYVLDGIDLEVGPGARAGIVGPNGAGKSTIARLLLRLLRPERGEVSLFAGPVAWARHTPALGYIGDPSRREDDAGLPADVTLGRLLDTCAELFARSGLALPHAERLVTMFGLDDPAMRAKAVGSLSAGERQKVLAFLALAKGPALLLADEPTAGLDSDSCRDLLRVVRDLADGGMALVWITHNAAELAFLGARVYRLEAGRLAEQAHDGFDAEVTVDGARTEYRGAPAGALLNVLGGHLVAGRPREVRVVARREHGDDAHGA